MENLKEKILKLRNEGKTYDEIKSLLNCSKGTISYHCNDQVKEYFKIRRRKNRKSFIIKTKIDAGGKCSICGYDKCLQALHFHHTNPENKIKYRNKKGMQIGVTMISVHFNQSLALEEMKKCILLCANCHTEVENGITILK